jgi:hypothetical protein
VTLDGTYERTLREIKETNWEFAQRLLQCVTVIPRPLRVEELAEFLAFDFKAGFIPKFREDWRAEDPLEAVLSTCSTLLALVQVGHSAFVQFSHFTVREFLTSSRFAEKRDTISHRYHVSMTPAHTFVAQTCLGILLHLDEDITRDRLQEYPLAKYAAQNWVGHARFEGVSRAVEEGMRRLFQPGKHHLAVWIWIYDPIEHGGELTETALLQGNLNPLHYAAVCGLHTIVELLVIEHPRCLHTRSFHDGSTALHLASREGHAEITRFLIGHGADATAEDDCGSTSLHEASLSGSVKLHASS